MCGIVGTLDARRRSDEIVRVIQAMADTMVERGPDGSGEWVDAEAGLGLGHRRLAVLDLSTAGAQPMTSHDGERVLTFNGEVYDHLELATSLRADGVDFRGHSDTEVLVESISRHGVRGTLDRIDGMFAFGVWDRRRKQLVLGRDRMGEKPLYYGTLGSGVFVFASTLDALRAHPDFDRPVDREALALYFRHKYVPAPWSIYAGIHKLLPGYTVTVEGDGTVGPPEPYWSLFDVVARGVTFDGSEDEAVDELQRLLDISVGRRLVADVGVGAFLSGGIDSSTVVAAAQRLSSAPVRTFTIGSPSSVYDEAVDARRVASHLGTDHTELEVSEEDALEMVLRTGRIWDEPFGDSSAVPTVLVSEMARRDVTVALSGDGGDELFLGYNRYEWVPTIWDRMRHVPVRGRRVGADVLRRVSPTSWDRLAKVVPASRRPRQVGLKVGKVLGVADASSPEEMFHRLTSHWVHPEQLVPSAREPLTIHSDPARWPASSGIVEHMAAVDAVTYLPDDILTKVDRASMSASLEARVPMLDRALVEFAVGLPVEMRLRAGVTKWPLRRLLSRSVPPELFERPKTGFGLAIEDWLAGPLTDWAGDCLRSPVIATFLDVDVVSAAWDLHRSGRQNLAYELWDVLMFASWADARSIT